MKQPDRRAGGAIVVSKVLARAIFYLNIDSIGFALASEKDRQNSTAISPRPSREITTDGVTRKAGRSQLCFYK